MGTPMTFDFGARARKASPNLTLPNGGNDAIMQGIMQRGAQGASTGAMMMPQPRLDPGMTPRQPVTTQAPLDRSQMPQPAAPPVAMPLRSPMGAGGFGGGLAGRAAVPSGRSRYDPNRIAEQRFRRTGNPDMLQSQQWYKLQADRLGGGGGQPEMMTPVQAPLPAGHFEPGRSTGSQVWVRDAPATPSDGGGMVPTDRSMMPQEAAPQPQQQPQQAQAPMQQPFGFPFPSLPWDGKGPLPPSTLGGGNGVPGPPPVQRFDVAGPDGKPLAWQGYGPDGKPVPAMHGIYAQSEAAKPKELPRISDEAGVETVDPTTGKKSTSPMRHYYFEPHPQTGAPVKRYVQDAASDGTGSTGYNPFAKAKPAASPAAPAPVPTATQQAPAPAPAAPPVTTQTGQMPNVPYANDLSPEQNLAAAREHYAQTGDDSKIREHFQSNPSPAMQHVQAAQKTYDQLGQLTQAEGNLQEQQQSAAAARDESLKRRGANAFTVGMHASDWAAANPQEAAALKNGTSFGKEKADLLAQAEKSMQAYGRQRESDRMTTKEEDFRRGWKMYKATGKTDLLTDSTKKGGKA